MSDVTPSAKATTPEDPIPALWNAMALICQYRDLADDFDLRRTALPPHDTATLADVKALFVRGVKEHPAEIEAALEGKPRIAAAFLTAASYGGGVEFYRDLLERPETASLVKAASELSKGVYISQGRSQGGPSGPIGL